MIKCLCLCFFLIIFVPINKYLWDCRMQRNISIVYDALFRQMYAKLFFYAKGLVGNEDDAQDVVEDVFTDLWQRRDDIEFGDQISSFLYRAVYTRSINLLKRRKISSGYIQQLDDISSKLLETLQSNLKNPVHTLENNEFRTDPFVLIMIYDKKFVIRRDMRWNVE